MEKAILHLSIGWKIKFMALVLLLALIDLVSTFSIAILIGFLAQTNNHLYFNLNIKLALLSILIFAMLKPRITALVNRLLSGRQSELELHILEQFLESELAGLKVGSNSNQYSRVLNRIEGELATIFNDFFPALILLITETLFLMFTLAFFVVNYPLLTIFGSFFTVLLITYLLKNSLKRTKHLQQLRSQLYARSLRDLQDVIFGLKESLVMGNFDLFYKNYIHSKSKLVEAKFAQDMESNYQRQLVEGTGLVALALFTLATQFDFISNDVSKSMLVIAFAIRLTPCLSRIFSAISRADSTIPVMKKLRIEVDLNFRDQLLANPIEIGLVGQHPGIQIENLSLVADGRFLVRQLSLTLNPGDVLGIEGPSGSGKTMLLETIAGLRYPFSGRIIMSSLFYNNMAYLKQDPHVMDVTTERNIRYLRKDVPDDRVYGLISELQIPSRENHGESNAPEVFSGGERQRLALARTLAGEPQLIFMDEPTSAQDSLRRDLIMKLVASRKNCILIICSHSQEILASCNKSLRLG